MVGKREAYREGRRMMRASLIAAAAAVPAAALACYGLALGAEAQPAPPAPVPKIAGWDEFVDALRELPARMLAKLPESERNDPQVQQQVGRLMLEALTASGL